LASRPAADVMAEAEQLVARGVRELLVISQDTSAYGVDLKFAGSDWRGGPLKARFFDLCAALGSLGAWVRLHYVYPYPHVDDVLPLMAEGKILPYLDIPFQHASPAVLKAMRRPAASEKTLERIARWRGIVPDLGIRSTFIVGFPGETEEDFAYLLDWLKEARLARVGCFKYENVEGAGSRDFAAQVPEEVKAERYERFMETQREVSAEAMAARVGREIAVIVDEVDKEGAVGRSAWDAPDIDGSVFLEGEKARALAPGDIVTAVVEETDEYDCWGRLV
jgi:ribosomal protein S12 methylthiotransferase